MSLKFSSNTLPSFRVLTLSLFLPPVLVTVFNTFHSFDELSLFSTSCSSMYSLLLMFFSVIVYFISYHLIIISWVSVYFFSAFLFNSSLSYVMVIYSSNATLFFPLLSLISFKAHVCHWYLGILTHLDIYCCEHPSIVSQ